MNDGTHWKDILVQARTMWLSSSSQEVTQQNADNSNSNNNYNKNNKMNLVEQLYRTILKSTDHDHEHDGNNNAKETDETVIHYKRQKRIQCQHSCETTVTENNDTTAIGNNDSTRTTNDINDANEDLRRLVSNKAREQLSLLLIQSGRFQEAKKLLLPLGYQCRLSSMVLDYPLSVSVSVSNSNNNNKETTKSTASSMSASPRSSSPPCLVWDHFLSPQELDLLQSVFLDPNASYWTDHDYQVEPPSPYVSYVIPLQQSAASSSSSSLQNEYGMLGLIIDKIHSQLMKEAAAASSDDRHTTMTDSVPSFLKQIQKATMVELWAHNRPHASGHQLHFDSDNEGRGGIIRNPICSTILYLSGSSSCDRDNGDASNNNIKEQDKPMESDDIATTATATSTMIPVGGPSLVTNQKLMHRHLATRGWMCHSKPSRLVVFDGKVLHGVIPGKARIASSRSTSNSSPSTTSTTTLPSSMNQNDRRVTLMMAFWPRIQIRESTGTTGAARPFPRKRRRNTSTTVLHQQERQKEQQQQQEEIPQWAQSLCRPPPSPATTTTDKSLSSMTRTAPPPPTKVVPIEIEPIYETLDGISWTREMGFPEYDTVFQGF